MWNRRKPVSGESVRLVIGSFRFIHRVRYIGWMRHFEYVIKGTYLFLDVSVLSVAFSIFACKARMTWMLPVGRYDDWAISWITWHSGKNLIIGTPTITPTDAHWRCVDIFLSNYILYFVCMYSIFVVRRYASYFWWWTFGRMILVLPSVRFYAKKIFLGHKDLYSSTIGTTLN